MQLELRRITTPPVEAEVPRLGAEVLYYPWGVSLLLSVACSQWIDTAAGVRP